MTSPLPDEAVFDSRATPRVTITRYAGGFRAVCEVEDIDAPLSVKGIDAEGRPYVTELATLGVQTLNPPTVIAQTHRGLIEGCQRAVQTAIRETELERLRAEHGGLTRELSSQARGTPGQILMVYLRTAIAVRACLRKLGEQI